MRATALQPRTDFFTGSALRAFERRAPSPFRSLLAGIAGAALGLLGTSPPGTAQESPLGPPGKPVLIEPAPAPDATILTGTVREDRTTPTGLSIEVSTGPDVAVIANAELEDGLSQHVGELVRLSGALARLDDGTPAIWVRGFEVVP